MINELEKIKKNFTASLEKATSLSEIDKLERIFLGPKGVLRKIMASLKELSLEERKEIGKKANDLKREIARSLKEKREALGKEKEKKEKRGKVIDLTAPAKPLPFGHLHPLTQTLRRVKQIFGSMGFVVFTSPEVETDFYNFSSLNIPPNHPARDLWDTFWIEDQAQESKAKLLRTHTTAMQLRYLSSHNPPLRIINPGRCFRYEAVDSSHDIQFYQVDGLMIDKNVSVANFKAIIESFFKAFFAQEVKIRLRPGYFPFVEPGFEVDASCVKCQGKKCPLCKGTGWLELMGAGMVHPEVLKRANLNPLHWQGFAFGMGIDRLAMIRHGISDIRLFYQNDIRFLKQF